jgi:hypothetical protein
VNQYNLFKPSYWFGQAGTRALSIFRIAYALIVLKDALYHLPLSAAFYTDTGVLPRNVLLTDLARSNRFSLMDALSADWMVVIFFILWVVVTICLLVGYRTRLMTVLNFVFVVSVQERNIYVLTGADIVMRVMAVWMLFLPLADYYSIDAIRNRWKRFKLSKSLADLRVSAQEKTTFALPLRAIQIQFALIYTFTALFKWQSPVWNENATAIFYALQLQTLTLPTGDWFLQNMPQWVMQVMTKTTILAEIGFLPLVFQPFFQPYVRMFVIFVMGSVHIGIMLLMSIADFSAIMLTGYLLFFAPNWIVWLDQKLRAKRQPMAIDRPQHAHDPRWMLLAMTQESEIAVSNDSTEDDYPGRREFVQMMAWLPLSRLWLWTLRIGPLYNLVCRNLTNWSASFHAMRKPRSVVESESRRWTIAKRVTLTALMLYMLIGIIWMNVLTLSAVNKNVSGQLPSVFVDPLYYTGLWQQWNMFAPYPSTRDGWIVLAGTFEDGNAFDLRTGEAPANEMKRWFWGPDQRWRKYDENVSRNGYESLLLAWARRYCIYYNVTLKLPEGKRLDTLDIIYRHRDSHDPNEPENPFKDQALWYHHCLAN